jgi:hypothetical protein
VRAPPSALSGSCAAAAARCPQRRGSGQRRAQLRRRRLRRVAAAARRGGVLRISTQRGDVLARLLKGGQGGVTRVLLRACLPPSATHHVRVKRHEQIRGEPS